MLVLVLVLVPFATTWADSTPTEVVSATPAGRPGTGPSRQPDLSDGGRSVAFVTAAGDVLPGDEEPERCEPDEDGEVDCTEVADVVVRDVAARTTERVSVSSDEVPGDADSGGISLAGPSITPDGRFVAFASDATNLVPGDTNGRSDVFVRDRVAGTTERVSVSSAGAQARRGGGSGGYGVAISDDGRSVAFETYADGLAPGGRGVFVHDRRTGRTRRVGRDGQGGVELSGDGRVVVYSTSQPVGRADTNDGQDVLAFDRRTGRTERVSVDARGRQGAGRNAGFQPAVSRDGRFVVFTSLARLVRSDTDRAADVLLRDRRRGTLRRLRAARAGRAGAGRDSFAADLSADGRFVALSTRPALASGDRGGDPDLLVLDRRTGAVRAVPSGEPTAAAGEPSTLRLSPDGRTAASVETPSGGFAQVLRVRVDG